MSSTVITIQAVVHAPQEHVWACWNEPQHIVNWAFASDDWECPSAENDLRVGGRFKNHMAAKDKSFSFDFGGVYTAVDLHQRIEYTLGDDRKVAITFSNGAEGVEIVQSFDAEEANPVEMQQAGWQAILDNFVRYTESLL